MEAWARASHSDEVSQFLDGLMKPWRDDLAEIVEEGTSAGTFQPREPVSGFPIRFCAVLDGLSVLRLRQMPGLQTSELAELAMVSARAELQPGTRPSA